MTIIEFVIICEHFPFGYFRKNLKLFQSLVKLYKCARSYTCMIHSLIFQFLCSLFSLSDLGHDEHFEDRRL
jgi:hypothetical protein